MFYIYVPRARNKDNEVSSFPFFLKKYIYPRLLFSSSTLELPFEREKKGKVKKKTNELERTRRNTKGIELKKIKL